MPSFVIEINISNIPAVRIIICIYISRNQIHWCFIYNTRCLAKLSRNYKIKKCTQLSNIIYQVVIKNNVYYNACSVLYAVCNIINVLPCRREFIHNGVMRKCDNKNATACRGVNKGMEVINNARRETSHWQNPLIKGYKLRLRGFCVITFASKLRGRLLRGHNAAVV